MSFIYNYFYLENKEPKEKKLRHITIHEDILKKEYENFKKIWDDHYISLIERDKTNKEHADEVEKEEKIKKYCETKYFLDFGVEFNDVKKNKELRVLFKDLGKNKKI